jgi:vacuolar protein sorting-associated protein 35
MRAEKRTMECLKKGARIASQCVNLTVQVQLFAELLNYYIYYFERGNTQITISMLNQV